MPSTPTTSSQRRQRQLPILIAVLMLAGCSSMKEKTVSDDGLNLSEQKADSAAAIFSEMGLRYMQQENYKLAMVKLRKAQKLDPELPSTYLYLGQLYARLEEYQDAEANYRKAITIDPHYSRGHNNYGAFLCARKRYAESEIQFLAALKDPLYDRAAATLENLGLCTLAAGETGKAQGYFEKALKKNPLLPQSLYHLARISYDQGDIDRAKRHLEQYRKIAPQSPATLALGIEVEQGLGDSSAEASLRLMLHSVFPNSPEAKRLTQGGEATIGGQ